MIKYDLILKGEQAVKTYTRIWKCLFEIELNKVLLNYHNTQKERDREIHQMKYKCALISRVSLGRQSMDRSTILTHNCSTRDGGGNKFKSINFSLEMLALSARLSAIHLLCGMSWKVVKNAAKVIYGKLGALPIPECRREGVQEYVFDRWDCKRK